MGLEGEGSNPSGLAMNKKEKHDLGEILIDLTQKLISDKCTDMVFLRIVDKLCRRIWTDIHPGWVRWSYYIAILLSSKEKVSEGDFSAYEKWAEENCK